VPGHPCVDDVTPEDALAAVERLAPIALEAVA
jgi:hypothetical protein